MDLAVIPLIATAGLKTPARSEAADRTAPAIAGGCLTAPTLTPVTVIVLRIGLGALARTRPQPQKTAPP